MDFTRLLILIPSILLALTVHEYAHGLIAFRLGDPTAKHAGRLTLNPLSHLDPLGTIVLLITQRFGWAKPVPVNPYYFKNPRRDMIWVAIAGPGSNILLALVIGIIQQFLVGSGIIAFGSIGYVMISFTVFINLVLAFFNLLPIPPLDGSKVVSGFIPIQYLRSWEKFERFGGIILIVIILFGSQIGLNIFKPILWFSLTLYKTFTGETFFM